MMGKQSHGHWSKWTYEGQEFAVTNDEKLQDMIGVENDIENVRVEVTLQSGNAPDDDELWYVTGNMLRKLFC